MTDPDERDVALSIDRMVEAYDLLAKAKAEKDHYLKLAMAPVAEKLKEIDRSYAEVERQYANLAASLESEVRARVIALRRTVQSGPVSVQYKKGRVTYAAAKLDALCHAYTFLEEFRKEGKPSTAIIGLKSATAVDPEECEE